MNKRVRCEMDEAREKARKLKDRDLIVLAHSRITEFDDLLMLQLVRNAGKYLNRRLKKRIDKKEKAELVKHQDAVRRCADRLEYFVRWRKFN